MPRNLVLVYGTAAALVIIAGLLFSTLANSSHDSDEPGAQEGDVGPGSTFATEHPTLLPTVVTMIKSHGHKCPTLVNLWNEPDARSGTRLEAICGPDRNHIDTSLHYAVYLKRAGVNVCQPWREFGPDCE